MSQDHDPDTRYRHWSRRVIYTSGIKFLCDEAGAYWLVDAIASHLGNPKIAREEFQVWKLKVESDRSARLWVTDGNSDRAILEQSLEFSDFPEPYAEFFLCRTPGEPDVLMLPCEY